MAERGVTPALRSAEAGDRLPPLPEGRPWLLLAHGSVGAALKLILERVRVGALPRRAEFRWCLNVCAVGEVEDVPRLRGYRSSFNHCSSSFASSITAGVPDPSSLKCSGHSPVATMRLSESCLTNFL